MKSAKSACAVCGNVRMYESLSISEPTCLWSFPAVLLKTRLTDRIWRVAFDGPERHGEMTENATAFRKTQHLRKRNFSQKHTVKHFCMLLLFFWDVVFGPSGPLQSFYRAREYNCFMTSTSVGVFSAVLLCAVRFTACLSKHKSQ